MVTYMQTILEFLVLMVPVAFFNMATQEIPEKEVG